MEKFHILSFNDLFVFINKKDGAIFSQELKGFQNLKEMIANVNLVETSYDYVYQNMGMHTVVGYGYYEVDYYDVSYTMGNTTPFRRDEFAILSNGWGGTSYLNSKSDSVSQAYGIFISIIPAC